MRTTSCVLAMLVASNLFMTSNRISADDIFEPRTTPQLLAEQGAGEGPAWHPDLGLLTSGGGNIWRRDKNGQQTVYRENAGTNGLLFDRQGRLVMCHEGGYSTAVVPFCGVAVLEELSGSATDVIDPFLEILESTVGHELTPQQDAQIGEAERVLQLALST